jgi:transposase
MVRDLSCGDLRIYLGVEVRRVDCGTCGQVKRERLIWLADNPFYTKRFAFFVGRRCRASTIKDVAKEAVHAGTVAPRGHSGSQGDRHR